MYIRKRASLALLAGALAACARISAAESPQAIAVETLHMTAAGKFIDLRYRVLDAEKASALLGKQVRPKLIDERTGTEMAVPTTAKLGALRQTQGQQKTGRTYFILFANNGSVGPGSKVTAQIGPMVFPHLTVE